MTPDQVDDLLACAAIGALDLDERTVVEDMLAVDPLARLRLEQFETAVALLAHELGPPASIWEQRLSRRSRAARIVACSSHDRRDRDTELNSVPVHDPDPQAFQMSAADGPHEFVLTICGDIDRTTSPILANALARASERGRTPVIVDLTALRWLDVSGVGVLVKGRRLLRERSRDLKVRAAGSLARRILSLLDLNDMVEPAVRA